MSKGALNFATMNDNQKSYASMMSSDLCNDLQDAFDFYDEGSKGYISQAQFRNILQNFGYHAMGVRDANEELKKLDTQVLQRNAFDLNFVKEVIAFRQYKGTKESGRDEEARECFRLFDKYEKNMINFQNIKTQLGAHLEFSVTENEIHEFMEFVGHDNGWITYKDFVKFYQS